MITITFASLELSSTVTRYTVIDGGFPLNYDGNTYLNDGLVVALDKTVISAELANVTQNITLFLDNDVKNAIQTDTYRNRRAKIFKGEWDPSTSTLSEVRSIYEGIIDTYNTPKADGTVEFIIASLIAPLRRPSDNISLQVLHNQRIEDGVYGASNAIGPTVDTFLRNAGQSFQDFTLGASEYRKAVTKPMYIKQPKNLFGNHKRKYVGEETVTPEIQETPGSQLEQPASYQPARVYGVSGVNAAIVAAWNHKTSGDFAKTKQHYGTNWRGFEDEEASNAIRPDTRFGTIVYLVHAGEVDGLNIYFDGLSGDIQSRSLSLTSGDTTKQYLRDEYEDKNGNTRNNTYAVVEALWGANNQSPPASWIATSNGQIDANFRGVGYVLVAITYEATRDGAVSRGIPEVGFQVKQTKSVSMNIPAWSETTIAFNTGYSYDNTSPYSTNSFYVENFLLFFASSRTRPLETGQSFKSAFSGGFLTLTPDSAFAADLDLAYGLSSTTLSAYNFVDGITDIQITQSGNYGKFKVVSASRNAAGTNYRLWLAGDKGSSGTIDIAQSFDFGIEETIRTGSITALTTRVANQHPARVIVDYLMDKQVGPGLSADDIDLESFLLCQENAAKIPQYVNGVMQGKDTFVEYIQDIADTANLTLYQEGDKIKCRFRKPVQASDVAVTFTENNCSDMELINFRNEDKFNEFLLTVDLQKISNVKAPRITGLPVEVRDTSYLSQDNGIRSIGELTSEWLTLFYSETVDEDGNTTNEIDESESSEYLESYEQYARFLMDISRFYEEIELTTTYSIAKDFTIGTVFDVENDLYGFTGNNIRRYEVVDYADNHDGTVSLVGQRHSNSIFGLEDDFSNNVFDSLEPTILPYTANSESAIPSAPSLTAVWEPISRRIDLSWTEPSTNAFNTSHYQVQEQANDETDWTTISEQLVTSDRVFSRAIVERGGIYKYRVRALTAPGMINGPFSSEKYIRLDLAFGDNKPEQQRVIITGNRSNASVASTVDTTVTIGLPTNFEAAPADETGTGATSNIGQLGVDLDVTSDFVSAATDSDSGTTATSSTALPGTPSGGSYEVVDTFQAALTGSTSATDATSTTGTFNLSNSAGSIAITSDFSEATTGRFPASGTSVSAVASQALPNGAGTLTVTSDFTASESASLSGEATHSMATLTDIGTQTGSTSGAGTYSDIGTTDIDLTVSSVVASAITSSAGTGTKTQSGSDSTTARTAVVATQTVTGSVSFPAGSTYNPQVTAFSGSHWVSVYGSNSPTTVSSISAYNGVGMNQYSDNYTLNGTPVRLWQGFSVINHLIAVAVAAITPRGQLGGSAYFTNHGYGNSGIGDPSSNAGLAISALISNMHFNGSEVAATVPGYQVPGYIISSQTPGSGWSNNAATINSSTGAVSFPQQDKTKYAISEVPVGADIDLVINGITLDQSNTSTEFGDTNTSRSWTLTGGIPIGLGTQTGSTSGDGTYSDIGTTDIDLTVSSIVASAITSSAGTGNKTQPGPDGTTARTAVVSSSTAVTSLTFPTGSTFGSTVVNSGFTTVYGSNRSVSTSNSGYPQYTGVVMDSYKDGYSLDGTPIRLWIGIVDANINIGIVMATITKPGQLGGTSYEITAAGGSAGLGDIGSNIGLAYFNLFNNLNTPTWGPITVPGMTVNGFAISSQSAGTDWSNNAATIDFYTGAVSFPQQDKTKYAISEIPVGADIDLVINGRTLDQANTSTGFGDTNTSRSWTLTGTLPSDSSGTNSPINIGGIGTGQSDGLNLSQSGSNYILTNNYSKTLPKVVVTVGGVTSTINTLTSGSSSTIAIPSSGNIWTVTVSFPAGTYDLPNDSGTLTITEDTNGIASYILDRLDSNGNASGFTDGTGLTVNGVSRQDSYGNSGLTIKPWSVNISTPDSGSTVYTLVRPANFNQEAGIVLLNPDGSTSSFFSSKEDTTGGILPYFAISGKLQTGQTNYTFSPDSAFTDNQEFLLGGTAQLVGSAVADAAAPRAYSVQATRPASGNTTYTFTPNTGFTGEWTINSIAQGSGTHQVVDTTSGALSWSISTSRPQSGGTTYELAGGQANLGISLSVNGQTLTEISRSHTFIDADTNRSWSATFAPTTFSLEIDPNDVVYVGNSYEIISQAITKGADEDDTLTEIANAVTAMDTNITWDSTISTNGTTGNREITIDLGTTSNIGFDIALGGKNSKNPNITDIETLGAGVNFSSYTLTSPDGGSTLNFNGFTIDATVADRNTVINEAVRQVDVNAEAPKDFLATSDGNSLIFTARTTGTSAGQWNFAWNHGSSTGNLRAKQYETDSDSTSSANNVDAEVVREGVVDGTVNNTSFPSGTYSATYTDAVRDERNFFAERAVIYSEGDTEPTVSITTNDYTWREILSSG
jgi:hypothetical protein